MKITEILAKLEEIKAALNVDGSLINVEFYSDGSGGLVAYLDNRNRDIFYYDGPDHFMRRADDFIEFAKNSEEKDWKNIIRTWWGF